MEEVAEFLEDAAADHLIKPIKDSEIMQVINPSAYPIST
jgi:hypothetical protein